MLLVGIFYGFVSAALLYYFGGRRLAAAVVAAVNESTAPLSGLLGPGARRVPLAKMQNVENFVKDLASMRLAGLGLGSDRRMPQQEETAGSSRCGVPPLLTPQQPPTKTNEILLLANSSSTGHALRLQAESDRRVPKAVRDFFLGGAETDRCSQDLQTSGSDDQSQRRVSIGMSWLESGKVRAGHDLLFVATDDGEARDVVADVIRDVKNPRFPWKVGFDFSFDVRQLQPFRASPLVLVAHQVLARLQLYTLFSAAARNKFLRFVSRIAVGYNSCPYHRELHAADVTSRVCSLIIVSGLDRCKHAAFSAILAAIVHDVEHQGLSNDFHEKAKTELSKRWHGSSPLENNSIDVALAALEDPAFDFLSEWAEADKKKLRHNVIAIVQATDLKKHFDFCAEFQSRIVPLAEEALGTAPTANIEELSSASMDRVKSLMANGHLAVKKQRLKDSRGTESAFFESLSGSEQLLVLQMVMKAADIGHCCMPLGQHLFWCSQLEEEMLMQGRLEKSGGLEISPLCDETKGSVTTPSIQLGFFHAIVIPLLGTYTLAFPSSKPLLVMARSNTKYWTSAGGN